MDKSEIGSTIIGLLLGLYGVMSQIMAVVFFVDYCKNDDSLFEIMVFDTFLSELKGLVWPFFI